MALKILQPGIQPLGQFDLMDSYVATILGGEVGTLRAQARTNSASEKAAHDALEGYDNSTDVKRAAIQVAVPSSGVRPIWLLDEGFANYGTLFGQVIGTPAGLSTTGTNLGPSTAAASGKVTCWDKDGLYGVTTDAVYDAADGIDFDNAACVPGVAIRPRINGKLALTSTSGVIAVTVGRFIEFATSPYLVNTPNSLVGAAEAAVWAVFYYNVEG